MIAERYFKSLALESAAREAVLGALPAFGRNDRLAHLFAGAGENLVDLSRRAHRRGAAIEADSEFCAQAKATVGMVEPQIADLFGYVPLSETDVKRCRQYAFRNECPTRTSLSRHSCSVVIAEICKSGRVDHTALRHEIERIAAPGARVILIKYGLVRVQDWDVDDKLAPYLWSLNGAARLHGETWSRLRLKRLSSGGSLYAKGMLNATELLRVIVRTPELTRLAEKDSFVATAQVRQIMRKCWRGKAKRKLVRREVSLFVGSVPQ